MAIKDRNILIRVSDNERNMIRSVCSAMGMTQSATVLSLIRKKFKRIENKRKGHLQSITQAATEADHKYQSSNQKENE